MYLAEEYLSRHSIESSFVKHTEYGVVFFRREFKNKNKNINWIFLEISYENNNVHPGIYRIKLMEPVHNGGKTGRLFSQIGYPVCLQWDEYEDWMLNKEIPDSSLWRPIIKQEEIILFAWEMFVYTQDSWISKHALDDDLFSSLNDDLDLPTRYKHYQNIIKKIFTNQDQDQNQHFYWTGEMMNFVKKYCHWWVKNKTV